MREPIIICVSANPGMDRRLRLKSLVVGGINRAGSAEGFAGGKAAHVAMAAHALQARAVWIAFLGGAIGQECATQMESLGIRVRLRSHRITYSRKSGNYRGLGRNHRDT